MLVRPDTLRKSALGQRDSRPLAALLLRMTLDEFLAWDPPDPTGRAWQLVDGEPVPKALGTQSHGAIQAEAGTLLGNHLLVRSSCCRAVINPGIIPRVRASLNFRVVDLGVACAPPSFSVEVLDPVLLIEVLAPSDEAASWANIWAYTRPRND
jgi:Uma2 family endonuclease